MDLYKDRGYVVVPDVLEPLDVQLLYSLASTISFPGLQEVPVEQIENHELHFHLTNIVNSCVMNRLSEKLSRNCFVPESWDQVLYIRKKKLNEFTPVHCDAYNVLVERRHVDFLQDVFSFNDLYSYATFWIPLTAKESHSSWLQIDTGSHLLPDIQLNNDCIQPSAYSWETRKKSTISVKANPGDCVVFNILVQHKGSLHRSKQPRFSIDGRFMMSCDTCK